MLNIVREGHNIFITGQGGTGKSFLVKEIYKELTRSGKRVAIICSSGIAGTIYDGHASTVHSFYELKRPSFLGSEWLRVAIRKYRLGACKMKKSKVPKLCQNIALGKPFLEKTV